MARKPALPDNNPKTRFGLAKPSFSKFPSTALLLGSLAMMDGAVKYGPYNWRQKKVTASIYVDAAKRHIDLWYEGEECASDSKKPHLGHAMASLAILVDAYYSGNLIDDRPPPGPLPKLMEKWTTPLSPTTKVKSAAKTKKKAAAK